MLGKFCISGAYAVVYLFSTEQFPTVVKNSGLGMCSLFARFGGLACPYVVLLGGTWKPLPLIIFGALSGGFLKRCFEIAISMTRCLFEPL